MFGVVNEFDGNIGEVESIGFFVMEDIGDLEHVSIGYKVRMRVLACPMIVILYGHNCFSYVYAVFFFEYACANVLVYHVCEAIGTSYYDYVVYAVVTVFLQEDFFKLRCFYLFYIGLFFYFEDWKSDAVVGQCPTYIGGIFQYAGYECLANNLCKLAIGDISMESGFYVLWVEGGGVVVVDRWQLCGVAYDDEFVAAVACGVDYQVLQ